MSRKESCLDVNTVAEAFFGSVEKELTEKQIYRLRDVETAAIADYIETFYNRSLPIATSVASAPSRLRRLTSPGTAWPLRPGICTRRKRSSNLNGLRGDCSERPLSTSIEDAEAKIDAWRVDYSQTPTAELARTPDARRVCRTTSGPRGR